MRPRVALVTRSLDDAEHPGRGVVSQPRPRGTRAVPVRGRDQQDQPQPSPAGRVAACAHPAVGADACPVGGLLRHGGPGPQAGRRRRRPRDVLPAGRSEPRRSRDGELVPRRLPRGGERPPAGREPPSHGAAARAFTLGVERFNYRPQRTRCAEVETPAAKATLERLYPGMRVVHIPLVYDTERFRPDPELREQVRAELGAGPDEVVALYMGRNPHDQGPRPRGRGAGRRPPPRRRQPDAVGGAEGRPDRGGEAQRRGGSREDAGVPQGRGAVPGGGRHVPAADHLRAWVSFKP